MIYDAIEIDVENLLYAMLNVDGMEEYAQGIYTPYELEPIALYGSIMDKDGRVMEVWDFDNEMWTDDGIVINDLYRAFDWAPYIPYRPMKALIEYCKIYLDNMIDDRDILRNCPILDKGPIGYYNGYVPLSEVTEDLYGITLPSEFDSASIKIDDALNTIRDSGKIMYNVTCIGNYLSITPLGNIYEIRYKMLLEEIENYGKETICKKRNDTLDRGI